MTAAGNKGASSSPIHKIFRVKLAKTSIPLPSYEYPAIFKKIKTYYLLLKTWYAWFITLFQNENPVVTFKSAKAWTSWLDKNYSASQGVWLKIAKKGAASASVTYAEALESALCYGWIDGKKRPLDAAWWLQRFVPRSPRSLWSRINRDKAEALIAQGRMHAAGLAAIEQARKNGRWESAYDAASRAAVPPDLQQALDANPDANAFFQTLDKVNRYAVLFRIQTVKKVETRARKIVQFVEMLARQEKLHP